ncbi:MAG: helix-turn-helix transcriptional regulator [Rhodanobacter sp.]
MTNVPNPASIEPATMERIYSLWDALAEMDVSNADDSLHALLTGACQLLTAQAALCVVVVRMPQTGTNKTSAIWRPCHVMRFDPDVVAKARAEVTAAEHRLAAGGRDIWMANNVAAAGTWRAKRLCELVPPEWFESDYYNTFYTRLGLKDAIWVGCPINTDVEIYMGISRASEQAMFAANEPAIALFAVHGLHWLLKRYLLSLGLDLAAAPLTEAERDVLKLLLHGHSPQAIAEKLSQSVYTTREHIQRIYRKFNVTRRSALAALWAS